MTKEKHKKVKKNWLEWAITIFSGILVVFTFGFLVYQMIYEEKSPPDIRIVLGALSQKDGAYAIPITVTNTGTETAENVMVEIILEGGPTDEKSQMTFAYLPRKSSVEGWVVFSRRPIATDLKTRVLGYSIP